MTVDDGDGGAGRPFQAQAPAWQPGTRVWAMVVATACAPRPQWNIARGYVRPPAKLPNQKGSSEICEGCLYEAHMFIIKSSHCTLGLWDFPSISCKHLMGCLDGWGRDASNAFSIFPCDKRSPELT